MSRMVFATRVVCRNFVRDFLASVRNIVGGRVAAYEEAMNEAIKGAYAELKEKHPSVRNVRLMTSGMMVGATEIIVYGEVDE